MILSVNHVSKSYLLDTVIKDASFHIEEREKAALVGLNGAGKTTLFNCMNEDVPIDGGSIVLEDNNGSKRPLTADDIGYVLSTPVVPDFLTAREFIRFFLDINRGKIESPREPDEYLDYMQIDQEDRFKLIKDFSHGMKNKMQLLVNFIADPPILLLDEPLTALDVVMADEMKRLLKRRKQSHITILSTHIMELALDICDDIVILHNGVLAPVSRDQLDDAAYKDRIIAALKEESNA